MEQLEGGFLHAQLKERYIAASMSQHTWVGQEVGEGQRQLKVLEQQIKSGGMFIKGEGRYS